MPGKWAKLVTEKLAKGALKFWILNLSVDVSSGIVDTCNIHQKDNDIY